jgi:hypothetical protein
MTNIWPNTEVSLRRFETSNMATMRNPRWLDIVRHRIRGVRAPYFVILQHHDVGASTRLAAPLTLPIPGDVDALAPKLTVDGREYRARILDMSPLPNGLISNTVGSAVDESDAIAAALDIILHGYPVGLPH